jgi:hypothetical protein
MFAITIICLTLLGGLLLSGSTFAYAFGGETSRKAVLSVTATAQLFITLAIAAFIFSVWTGLIRI